MAVFPPVRPSVGEIFVTWLTTGAQSFGGGSSTFYLLHQACIGKGWMDEDTFLRTWALSQISPGIHLLKLTVLVGYGLRGWAGVIAGVAGLMIPSAAVTVLMTAGFELVRANPLVQSAMRGVMPAAIGLSLAMAVQMGKPLLMRSRGEGKARLGLHLSMILAAALLLAVVKASPLLILVACGLVTIGLHWVIPARSGTDRRARSGKGGQA